jgi:hypothetical protein
MIAENVSDNLLTLYLSNWNESIKHPTTTSSLAPIKRLKSNTFSLNFPTNRIRSFSNACIFNTQHYIINLTLKLRNSALGYNVHITPPDSVLIVTF